MADPIGTFSGLASGIQWRDMVEQIMNLEAARKLSPIQRQISAQEARQKAWTSFSGLVSKLNDASKRLRDATAFNAFKSTAGKSPSGKELFTATASSTAAAGSYRLEVIQLARAEKLNSAAVADANAALNLSGEFHVNGKKVEITSGDTLASIRDRINSANSGSTASGVTATILSTSATSHRLVLTSDTTGSRGIELVDGTGGVLQGLGVVDGTLSRNASPTDSTRTESQRFSAKTTALSSLLGLTAPPAKTTVTFGGVKVEVDLSTDTLISVLNRVKAAGGDASIVEETVGGKTHYRLSSAGDVTADAAASDPAASQRIVELLGFVRGGRANEISAGQDAIFRVDGFKMNRRTNMVSDAITGVTLNLLTANASERTSSITGTGLSITTDPKTIDPGSYDIVLTSTSTTRSVTTTSADLAVSNDPGVADGTYGVSLSTTTTRSTSTSTSSLSVTASPGTVTAGTYAVNITRAATKATATGSVATGTYANGGDTMTFVDNVNGVTKAYTLTSGQDLDSVVAGLNGMFSANGMAMTATNEGGALKVVHDTYGSASDFLVTVSHTRVSNFFGIGSTGGTSYNGVDVAGTIGGQAATGVGQTLTASAGAVNGLQVQYTGTATGSPVGTVTVTDTTAITGGTIGGQAATWDAGTGTLTVGSGSLAGLGVTYSGAVTSGAVGDVVVSTTGTASISSVTIDGVAAVWDAATSTIRGATGSDFEGLVLGYSGPAVNGSIGTLTVAGEIAADLTITADVDSTVADVQKFAAAFNEVVKFVDEQNKAGGVLGTSGGLRAMLSALKNPLISNVTGLSSATTSYTRAGAAGVAITQTGQLEVDAEKLKSALQTNAAEVKLLFALTGSGSTADLQYISSGDKTRAGVYAVDITQVATQAAFTGSNLGGGFTYTASDGVSDALTVTDAHSGKTQTYTVAQGKSLAVVVSELNSMFENEGMRLTAEVSGNSLKITARDYGTGGGFTLVGTEATTRLGLLESTWAGVDVQGTLTDSATGEIFAATGNGQVLTAATGTAIEGLSLRFSGSSIGAAGTLTFTTGVGGSMVRAAEPIIRSGDGTVVTQNAGIDRSLDSLRTRVSDVESRLEVRRQALLSQFTRMEEALSRLQSQGSWLAAQLQAMQGSQQ